MNGPIDNENMKPLRDEQLGEVSGGVGCTVPYRGINGMFGTLEQRGTSGGAFGTLEQRSVRPCPKCRRAVAPVGGKCPVCGALMTGSPAESI